jgi:hypothetical protein
MIHRFILLLRLSSPIIIITFILQVEFFHMKPAHVFQLIQPAHSPPASPNHTAPHESNNIFLASAPPEKLSENELQHSKSYELVGVRELISYKNRAKKRTKVSVKDSRDDLPSERSISRESCKKKTRPDPELFNK